MKTTTDIAKESRVNGWFGIFLFSVFILTLTFFAIITAHVRDVFIQWLAGILGGFCLAAIAVAGLLIHSAWEDAHRERASLESACDALRAIIQNEAGKQGLL